MKLQKLTEKRWFWPLVCAVSVVFGWWYLSIVTCAPLGGDDELINLQNYYYITHTSFGQSVLDYIGVEWRDPEVALINAAEQITMDDAIRYLAAKAAE